MTRTKDDSKRPTGEMGHGLSEHFERHRQYFMGRLCLMAKNLPTAIYEDILQEVAIRVHLRDLVRETPIGSREGYIIQAIRHEIIDRFRENVRHNQLTDTCSLENMRSHNDEDAERILTDSLAVRQALHTLTTKQYDVMLLWAYGNMTLADIATKLTISKSAVYGRKQAALMALRRCLGV